MPNRQISQIRNFPRFTCPLLEGAFSVDANRNYQHGFQNLKYLKIPQNVRFDLNQGDEKYVPKPPSADDEKLDHILNYIMDHKDQATKNNRVLADFICFRGLLRMLMCTPYEEREPWIVLATKFRNTIYLCAEETPLKKAEKARRTERDYHFIRYGFKFESYILSNDPSKNAPGNTEPVIESEEFCGMFSTEIDGKKILYGAEMDGVDVPKSCKSVHDLRKAKFVEVKVKRRETNDRQVTNFYRFKGRNFWCQSFLVNVNHIHVGLRNDDGIVDEVIEIPLKELSDAAKHNNFWHGTTCVNFLNDFLKMIVKDMKLIDDPKTVFRYQYDSRQSSAVTMRKIYGHHSFLTPEFIAFIEKL